MMRLKSVVAALVMVLCGVVASAQTDSTFFVKGSMGRLAAHLQLPALSQGEKCHVVVICHGFTGNMEEYNYDFTNPRMYAETIGETAADVGLGIAAGAVVATLAGPLAPVWAVGVVTAGSVMLVDMISEAAFGKDAAEFVSDLAIDTVEAVGDAAAKAGELIGEAAGKAADFVADTAKNVGSAVLSVGKSIGSKLKGLFS